MPAIRSMDEDGKKLGFVVNGSEGGGRRRGGVGKNEHAEEKACFGRDDDIDPDALSYIDEKIQNVLGHFQKEFEGGVSGESLGAKFGGYGSFLPVYSRSPSISLQPKSPVKTPNHNVSRSPNNLQSQDGHQNPSILGTTSITKVSIGSEGQITEKSGIKKTSISVLQSERILQSFSKPVNLSDKKMQEVRMMVGNEDSFPRKKPDIYSDLGLDVSPSPSPSPDDIPNRNEECSSESADAFLESPTTILQIMTCFSVPGGYILSPLPDSLQNSNGKEDIFLTNFKTGVLRKGQTETCAASSDTSVNLKFVNGSACKKVKSGDKGDVMPFLKEETGVESLVAQKVICNAPDISQSSHASCGDAREERQINGSSAKEICNTAGKFKDSDKLSLKERIPASHVSTDSHVEFVENMRNDFAGNSVMESIHSNGEVNSKAGLTTKSFGERIGNNQDTSCQPTETGSRALKNFNTTKADSKSYDSGWKNHAIEHKGPAKQNQNPAQKAASCEKGRIDQPYDGEIIPLGSPTNDLPCTEPSKENLRTSSSVELKRKNGFSYESKLEENKSHKKKKKGKAVESHNGFGESTHIHKVDENKHSFGSSRFIEKSELELGLDKVDNHQIVNLATDELGIAPLACNAPTSDADSTIFSSVIKENWVFCDLCQTWRLLPYGTNLDKLPKKWQCSMQVWLPGLNKCYISQDETTKAFHQFYPVPAPLCGTYLTIHPDAAVSGIASDDILNENQRLDNNACSIPSGVKTKNGLLDASNLPNSSSLNYSISSGKKLKASSENRNLNDVVHNSLDKDSSLKHGIRQTSRSAELSMEKQNHEVEEKPFKIPAACPNEGDLFGKGCKNSRLKSRKQVDLGHRSSKKIKKDALHYSEKNVNAEDEIEGKMAINGDYDLPPRASRKVLQNTFDHFSSEDFNSKFAPSKNPKKSIGSLSNVEHKEHVTASRTEKNCKYDYNDEKRGIKENSMISQQLVENRPMIKDASGVCEQRRQKKSKLANSIGKDSSDVIVDGKMDKKGCFTKIKLPSCEKYQPNKVVEATTIDAFECVDGMNKDPTNVQLATAATSSSSKLLGSHISKVNLQEARESPVESVSSSPTRLLNTRNNSKKVRLSTKDDILSTGPSMKCSPRSNFLGDVDAIDQSGTMTKDQASKSHLIISKNSKAAKPKASSNHLSQIMVDRSEGSSGKMAQTCHTVTGQHEKNGWGSQTVHRSMKEINSEQYHADAVNKGATNSTKNLRKSDCLNEIHSKNLSQPSPTVPECTPTKRDGHININAFIQEARDLKHTASRLKNDGLERESSGIYFEASMKFLHVAFLMEPPNSEIERQGDFIPSLQMLTMYVDTARLCEFCAHEYENLKEMAAAALAYKCAEVAYMKVAYFKHPSASKDRHELQAALDAALPGVIGESTTSTSDVDNLNNQEVFEKAASTRAARSPQLASSYVITARNRPHVKRLLTYTNYLNCAFEATNKSRNALAAASIDPDKDRVASLCSVREVLDFNFNNVERLLQLVRVSLNSISCKV